MSLDLSKFVATFIDVLSIFKSDAAIGIICAAMLAVAFIAIFRILLLNLHQNFCLHALTRNLSRAQPQNLAQMSDLLKRLQLIVHSYDYPALNLHWKEYASSVFIDQKEGVYATSIDPYSVFSVETLSFSFRGWERLASLFVSVGLVLTFMGLVASLQQSGIAILNAGAESSDIKGALSDLLIIVSSKFILSITGLACSIIINLTIDERMRRNRRDVANFNHKLRSAFSIIPSEVLLQDIRNTLVQRDKNLRKSL